VSRFAFLWVVFSLAFFQPGTSTLRFRFMSAYHFYNIRPFFLSLLSLYLSFMFICSVLYHYCSHLSLFCFLLFGCYSPVHYILGQVLCHCYSSVYLWLRRYSYLSSLSLALSPLRTLFQILFFMVRCFERSGFNASVLLYRLALNFVLIITKHPFHLVRVSPYPFVGSLSCLFFLIGFVVALHLDCYLLLVDGFCMLLFLSAF